jgi:hypothetical protein
MATKYRFLFEELDQYYKLENGKSQRKDEMLWEYDNFIIGISSTTNHFVMNHYNKNYDKSEYIMVSDNYTLDTYCDQWFDYEISQFEKSLEKSKEKVNVG